MADSNIYPSGQVANATEATKGRSPHWRALGLLAIAALLMGYVVRYVGAPDTWTQVIDRIVVSVGFFVLLFGLLFREITRIRKEKYANIQHDLHDIQHIARDQHTLFDLMQDRTEENLKLQSHLVQRNLQDCLNSFASALSIVTGTKCRAAIKMIEPGANPEKPVVFTYMRDIDSERHTKSDDQNRKADGSDLLEDNSDFVSVFSEEGPRWFFCNDLTTQPNYNNSRDPNLKSRSLSGIKAVWNLFRPVEWKVPYRSTIVWPIRQMKMEEDIGGEFSFAGFLTIDSPHRNVFDENFDTHLGAGVADCFYHILVRQDKIGTIDAEET
jgi:hypothetical protein